MSIRGVSSRMICDGFEARYPTCETARRPRVSLRGGWIRGCLRLRCISWQVRWGLSEWAAGIAVFLYVLPWLMPRRRENVQVDDTGVIVVTNKGRDQVRGRSHARSHNYDQCRALGRGRIFRTRRYWRQGLRGSTRCRRSNAATRGDAGAV